MFKFLNKNRNKKATDIRQPNIIKSIENLSRFIKNILQKRISKKFYKYIYCCLKVLFNICRDIKNNRPTNEQFMI